MTYYIVDEDLRTVVGRLDYEDGRLFINKDVGYQLFGADEFVPTGEEKE